MSPPAKTNPPSVSSPLRDLETDRDLLDAIDFIESCVTATKDYEITPPMRAAIKESLELLREKPVNARTVTSFVHYVNYLDPETKRPVIKEMLGDYLWDGGKYGKIFDARGSSLSLDTRFLAIEMEALMNRGPGCVVPALVYLFNLVEKKFDGRLTLLVFDEAWLFLKNEAFADKIAEWLKVLRKKNVFVVFATQDVADVERSPLKTTVIQQCLTKIYLADPSALTAGMMSVYQAFGLTDSEIALIAAARMKRDYFYTSPLGRRLFRLDLGPLTLALIGGADHQFLDGLAAQYPPGFPLCGLILEHENADFRRLLGNDAPVEPKLNPVVEPPPAVEIPLPADNTPAEKDGARPGADNELFDAILAMPGRKRKDGSGRAAAAIAQRFAVSPSTVYQARKVLLSGDAALVNALRGGELSVKSAYKRLGAVRETAQA
jgi:hypothetical protein